MPFSVKPSHHSVRAAASSTITQIALAWLITYYGDTVVEIPGASKPHHAGEAAAAMKVVLSHNELERLADLSSRTNR